MHKINCLTDDTDNVHEKFEKFLVYGQVYSNGIVQCPEEDVQIV